MDQQVVRSALKSYRNLFSTSPPSLSSLSAFSNYLRLLFTPPALNVSLDFTDPNISIVLLELRAALIVQDYAKNITVGKNPETDASADQRVSKAVTEAFVAVQVAGMIKALEEAGVKGHDANIVRKVYLLVGHFTFYIFSSPFLFLLHSDSYCAVSLDNSRSCTRRSPLVRSNNTSNSNTRRRTFTFVLKRSYACPASCYSTFMSRIDTRKYWVDGCFWIHGLGFG